MSTGRSRTRTGIEKVIGTDPGSKRVSRDPFFLKTYRGEYSGSGCRMSAQQRGRTRDYETEEKISAAADFTAHDADDMLSACKAQAVCQYCDNQPNREG